MKLLLTSAGLVPKINEVFLSLLTKPPAENKVAFITTAAYGEDSAPKWLAYYYQQFQDNGLRLVEEMDLKDYSASELQTALQDKDIIFVNGGNTFYLEKVLRQRVENGALYIGVSAGSYIACPTIEVAGWRNQDSNKVHLKDLNALNFVPFLIFAHYESKLKKLLDDYAPKTTYPLVALNDHQAVLIENNKVKLVGEGPKVFYNQFKESN